MLTDDNPGYEILKLEEAVIPNAPEVPMIEDMEEVTVKEEPKSDGEQEIATVEEEDVTETVKVENLDEDERDSIPRVGKRNEEKEEEKIENKPEEKVVEMKEKPKIVEKKRIVLPDIDKRGIIGRPSKMKTMVITLIQEGFGKMTNMPQFQLQFDPTQNMTLKFDTFDKHIRTRESGFTINIAGKKIPNQGLKPIKYKYRETEHKKPPGFTNKKTPTPPSSPPPPIPKLARSLLTGPCLKPVDVAKNFPPKNTAIKFPKNVPDDSSIGIAFTIPKGIPINGKDKNEDKNQIENDKEKINTSQTIKDDGETESCDGIGNGQDMPEVKEEVQERETEPETEQEHELETEQEHEPETEQETGGDNDDYEFFTGGMQCELCGDSVPDLAGYREHHYEKHAGVKLKLMHLI